MEDKIVVGLDIGTTKICAVVGKRNEYGKIEILGLGKAVSDGVQEGVVVNIVKTIDAITKAIKEASEDSKIDIGIVNVGIAGKHVKCSVHHGSITRESNENEITLSDVKRLSSDMEKILCEPGAEIIHVIPQSYTIDYKDVTKDPIGMSGVKLEADFNIITAHTNSIRNIQKCVQRGGFDIDQLMLQPLASSLAVLSEQEKEAGIVLVDIGGGTTDIAIFYDGVIRHTAVLPFGGNIITNDIKQGCAVMHQQAEALKVKYGSALSAEASENEFISVQGLQNRQPKEISRKNLALIIEARMEEVIDFITLEIQNSGFKGRLAGGIVITGGGAMLKGVKQLFELKTGMDTRVGYPNEHLGKCKHEEVKNPMYATAIGLVLAGYQQEAEESKKEQAKATTQPLTTKTKTATKPAATQGGNDLLSVIIRNTKKFLIDDYDDKLN
jgi:cell division protein FtsA